MKRTIELTAKGKHKFDVAFIYHNFEIDLCVTIGAPIIHKREDDDFPKMSLPCSVMKFHIIVTDNKFYPSETFQKDAIASFDDLEAMHNSLEKLKAMADMADRSVNDAFKK